MSPAIIALVLSLLEELIQEEPQIAAQIQAIFAKQNPTPADWLALHQQVLAKSYADYVPASALPAAASTTQPGATETISPAVATSTTSSNAPISQPGASETAISAAGTTATAISPAATSQAAALNPPVMAASAPQQPYLPNGSKNPYYVE